MRSCGLIKWMSFLGSSRGNPGSFLFIFSLLLLSNSSSQVFSLISFWFRMALHCSFHPSSADLCRCLCRIYQLNLFSLSHLAALLAMSQLLLYWGRACSVCNKLCELIVTYFQQCFICLLLPISYSFRKKQLCFSSVCCNCLSFSRSASSRPLLACPSLYRIWFIHPSSPCASFPSTGILSPLHWDF